jgi:hypothetical protein
MHWQSPRLTYGKLLGYDDAGGCLLVVSEGSENSGHSIPPRRGKRLQRLSDGGLLQTFLVEKLNSFVVSAKEMRQRRHLLKRVL